jgi:hypothetical protein
MTGWASYFLRLSSCSFDAAVVILSVLAKDLAPNVRSQILRGVPLRMTSSCLLLAERGNRSFPIRRRRREVRDGGGEFGGFDRLGQVQLETRQDRAAAVFRASERGQSDRGNARRR